ncbi:MAG: nicotinate-nucleotide--dimethylbenzimidazole phosphoribosyltransferase [Veillonella sp.]|nr:nicotinate-nucleotide--dimethylbenzimidazole phosphoribosyltransferase [Veillonella sp.]
MSLLQETCDAIRGRSHEIEQYIIDNWNAGSSVEQYGRLVNVVAQYGAATNQEQLTVPKPCMIIASADHGVADMGVSAYPKETTVGMTQNYLIPKGAGANSLANYCGAQMEVIDMGIDADMSWVPGLRSHKLGMGTKNFVEEPAMTREQAVEGIETGIRLVKEKIDEGFNVFLVGEMGISNTTASAAANNALVIIDGFNTSACALVAKTLVPQAMDYVMASHLSAEKAAKSSLENLGLEAYVDLGLCLGEASGGSIQMGMLDLAVHMYLAVTGGKA